MSRRRGANRPSYEYIPHNKVTLVRGGRDYFTTLIHLINQAKQFIHLQVYIFEDDETGQLVADALINAAKRGIHVYLMADGYASKDLSDAFIKQLQSNGVNFRYFEPLLKSEHFYFGRRLHHKVLVVDGYYGLVGGVNISNRYNDLTADDPAWLDWALQVEGPGAAELFKVCINVWARPGQISLKRNLRHQLIAHPAPGNTSLRIRRNDWVKRRNQISRSYIDMLKKASSDVLIMSSYFLPGQLIRHHLSRAAKRNIQIKVVVAGKSDVKLAKHAERYMYRWMLKRNIQLYEYNKAVLHAKLAVRDHKWVTIGSYNVNDISAYASVELNIDVNDPGFATQVQQQLEAIIATDCVLVTEAEFLKKYNFVQRTLQYISYWLVRVIFYLFTFYFKQK